MGGLAGGAAVQAGAAGLGGRGGGRDMRRR